MKVAIVGPNLPREAKAEFHVHAAGCADLGRGWIRRPASETVAVDMSSPYIYDFAPAETEGYELGQYQDQFYFAPCVDELPLGDPAAEADPDAASEHCSWDRAEVQ